MLDYFMYSYILGIVGIIIFFIVLILRHGKGRGLIDVKLMIILTISLTFFSIGIGTGIAEKYNKNTEAPQVKITNEVKPEQNTIYFYNEANANGNGGKTTKDIAKNKDAVILINTDEAIGSGFIINNSGYVITNHHVIDNSNNFTAVFQNKDGGAGEKIDMDLIAFDADADISLLKLKNQKKYSYVSLGDDDKISEGEKIVAIGSPQGIINTVSEGIVSGIRNIKNMKYIQISAAVSPGSSGGALFNSEGEVIGMPTFKVRNAENLNFAVSSKDIKKFLNSSQTIANIENYNNSKHTLVTTYKPKIQKNTFSNSNSNKNEYIIPYSSERKLQYEDIKNFNVYLMQIARNEIFARHGYIFTVPMYINYFNSKSWYKPNNNFSDNDLSDIEKYNASLMLSVEKEMKGE